MIPFGQFIEEGDFLRWSSIHGIKNIGWTVEVVEEFIFDPYIGYKGILLKCSDSLRMYYYEAVEIRRSFINGSEQKNVSVLSEVDRFIYSL